MELLPANGIEILLGLPGCEGVFMVALCYCLQQIFSVAQTVLGYLHGLFLAALSYGLYLVLLQD